MAEPLRVGLATKIKHEIFIQVSLWDKTKLPNGQQDQNSVKNFGLTIVPVL